MAPSRRQSNGRSPLVNQQRQITSFFSKSTSPSPSPSPILAKQNSPNPNSKNADHSSASPSPTTPSPRIPKHKKPLLVVGASSPSTPSPASSVSVGKQSYGQDQVGRRIKVYWPLDKAWYEGCVKSFDEATGKHLVIYDDDEEELLDLAKEKIGWVQEAFSKFKRLSRGISTLKQVVFDDDERAENVMEESPGADVADDDSSDEDWGKNEAVEDSDDDKDDMELEEEEDAGQKDEADKSKRKRNVTVECKKRKLGGVQKSRSAKKSKSVGETDKGSLKVSMLESTSNLESE